MRWRILVRKSKHPPRRLFRKISQHSSPLQFADIRKFLYELGHEAGAKYRANAKVVSVDVSGSSVTLESGEVLKADVIIGADGRHGLCRQLLLECQPTPNDTYTGRCMYKSVFISLCNGRGAALTRPRPVLSFRGTRFEQIPSCPNFWGPE